MFRYIGNKTKLLPVLVEAVKAEAPIGATVVDLMAGTGSVAVALMNEGYNVIASDMMTYSKYHLVSQLRINRSPRFAGLNTIIEADTTKATPYTKVIDFLNNLSPIDGYFFNEFSPDGTPQNGFSARKYFTSDNARKIDAIRATINDWKDKDLLTEDEEALLKHTLILAVNDVANISGTYGYFLSSFKGSALNSLKLEPIVFNKKASKANLVMHGFAEDLSQSITADLCYIDPPYMKRQYAANYHILETIARGDFPEPRGKSGLRNWWDQHSKFCTKTRIRDSFRRIFTDMNCNTFIISYSEDGLLSIEELTTLFQEFGDVSYKTIDYSRFRSNQSSLDTKLNEYLITLHRNSK